MQQEQTLGLCLIKVCVIFPTELHRCAQIQDKSFSFITKTITTIITVNTTSTALGACDPILAADTEPVPPQIHHLFNLQSIRDINSLPLNITGLLMAGFLSTSNYTTYTVQHSTTFCSPFWGSPTIHRHFLPNESLSWMRRVTLFVNFTLFFSKWEKNKTGETFIMKSSTDRGRHQIKTRR
jgi:hypothetical protein